MALCSHFPIPCSLYYSKLNLNYAHPHSIPALSSQLNPIHYQIILSLLYTMYSVTHSL